MGRVVVLLKNGDEQRFDAYCEAMGHKKSPLIARLIREHLDREGFSFQRGLFDQTPPSPKPKTKAARSRRQEGKSRQ